MAAGRSGGGGGGGSDFLTSIDQWERLGFVFVCNYGLAGDATVSQKGGIDLNRRGKATPSNEPEGRGTVTSFRRSSEERRHLGAHPQLSVCSLNPIFINSKSSLVILLSEFSLL